MSEYLKIENEKALLKSVDSGAIISCDNDAFNAYIIARDKKIFMEKRIDNLENQLSDIKQLLLRILENKL